MSSKESDWLPAGGAVCRTVRATIGKYPSLADSYSFTFASAVIEFEAPSMLKLKYSNYAGCDCISATAASRCAKVSSTVSENISRPPPSPVSRAVFK